MYLDKIAIIAKTKDEAKELFKEFKRLWIVWRTGNLADPKKTERENEKEKTIYFLDDNVLSYWTINSLDMDDEDEMDTVISTFNVAIRRLKHIEELDERDEDEDEDDGKISDEKLMYLFGRLSQAVELLKRLVELKLK